MSHDPVIIHLYVQYLEENAHVCTHTGGNIKFIINQEKVLFDEVHKLKSAIIFMHYLDLI